MITFWKLYSTTHDKDNAVLFSSEFMCLVYYI